MSDEKYQINVVPKDGTLIIEHREGKALELRDAHKIDIKGDLNAPKTFFDCRAGQFPVDTTYCHCTATTGQLVIELVGEDRKVDRIVVKGVGKSNPDMEAFSFGEGRGHTIDQLVKILRRKKHMFPEPELYQSLLNSLTNFKAKVDTTIEENKDTAGNVKKLLEKGVKSDVPASFVVEVQPYLNGPRATLLVETEVTAHADSVTVALYAFGLDIAKKECAIAVFQEMTDTIAAAGIPVIHDIQF